MEGILYQGLTPEERYYLTQLLIDIFDEFVDSEAVSDDMPLAAVEEALAPVRRFGTPLADTIAPTSYVELNGLLDAAVPYGGVQRYWKSSFLKELGDDLLDIFVAQHLRAGAHRRRGAARDHPRVGRFGDPFRQSPADLRGAQTVLDHLAREEISLDERAERAANAILARRHDGGVWDWDSKGMTEQRRHREPVGEATDHRRFRGRTENAEPREARFERARDDEDDRRRDEQQRRATLHGVERRLPRCFVLHDRHGARRDGQAHRGTTFTFEKSTRLVLEPAGTST